MVRPSIRLLVLQLRNYSSGQLSLLVLPSYVQGSTGDPGSHTICYGHIYRYNQDKVEERCCEGVE